MGRVYLARDTAVGGRTVALKVILAADRDEGQQAHLRFFREINNLGRLDHANIVTVFTAGNHEGYPYFVMRYVPGRDLSRYLEECSMLGERERIEKIVKVIAKVARALHHAHMKSIVHRDLKPANIVINEDADEPVILDFGIAKYLAETSLTKGPESPGTPAYRAPEQVDVRLKVRDELVDVWALGVILYRALTGTHPFKGTDALSISMQILHHTPPHPRALNPQIPEALEKIVMRCLEKEPTQRPESASAVAERVEQAIASGWGANDVVAKEVFAADETRFTEPVQPDTDSQSQGPPRVSSLFNRRTALGLSAVVLAFLVGLVLRLLLR